MDAGAAFQAVGIGEYDDALVLVVQFLAGFLTVFLPAWLLVLPALKRVVRQRNRGNPTLRGAIQRYVSGAAIVVAVLSGLVAAGYGRVLTGSALVVAAATLTVGVAGREVIGDLVSGLFLVTDRKFNVGDRIAWADSEGIVEAISFRITRVRTADNEVITVPNGDLATGVVRRPTAATSTGSPNASRSATEPASATSRLRCFRPSRSSRPSWPTPRPAPTTPVAPRSARMTPRLENVCMRHGPVRPRAG
ncbi:hypothetical protein BRC83_06670 [Halobacteriales archaeon QS_1_68_17]|nr:MAG: hypothetical protein BRC83_06670 [Halobacteriales archaeon QS_1_68_17]